MKIPVAIGTVLPLALVVTGCQTNESNPYVQEPYPAPDNPYSSYPAADGQSPYPQNDDYVDVAPVAPQPGGSGGAYQPPVYGSQPAYSDPGPVAASGGTYTVVRGDTLYSISRRHSTTVDRIKQANGLSSDTIYPGDVLTMP